MTSKRAEQKLWQYKVVRVDQDTEYEDDWEPFAVTSQSGSINDSIYVVLRRQLYLVS